MKKIVFLMIAAGALLVVMASCHKDEETNTNTNTTPQDTTQTTTQKHNVELVYSDDDYQHISLDTIRKYNADSTVDSIFMVPGYYNQYSTWPTSDLQDVVEYLRERKNVNPAKVWGKGELQLKGSSITNNFEIVRFFRDTLGYNVTYTNTK